ncbi:MAG: DNA-binding response regulator [Bradymonadales bacterium]|nr:MAG: DNA-binding response regulator [Bradymonadales bacterium]
MIQVLLIDDDERLGSLLTEYFGRYDIQLETAEHPDHGLKKLKEKAYDFVLLDVMLPERDGFEVCRMIREKSQVPIIMLTARGELADRVVGLEIGADDYVSKPFEPRELVARIERLHRRMRSFRTQTKDLLEFSGLRLDRNRRKLFVEETEVEMTTTEYQIFEVLATNPSKNFSRDEIQNALRGVEADVYSRSIDIMISRIRQKLKQAGLKREVIKTVWGTGYSFLP